MRPIADPSTWVFAALAVLLVVLAVAIVRARSLLAAGLMLAAFFGCAALAMLALDAGDVAYAQAVAGAGFVAVVFLGGMLLTGRAVKPPTRALRIAPLIAVCAAGLALLWAMPDLPAFGAAGGAGRFYVNRALNEIGMRNAAAAVLTDYRALDALAYVAALFTAGVGVFALLGFGERSGLRRPEEDAGP